MIRALFASALVAASAGTGYCNSVWSMDGFEMPESALYDSVENRVILSNIKGDPSARDGNGYLSLLTPDGAVIKSDWVTGLNAPKGMALVGKDLLVADVTELHVINAKTGALRQSIAVENAVFLNDVTSEGKIAWFTDFMTHTIWRYEDGEVTLWLQDPDLSHPNGIFYDKGRLVVGSWGQDIQPDFSTGQPGSLMSVDLESKTISTIAQGIGNLDGVARAGEEILVNDWFTGEIFAVSDDGDTRSLLVLRPGLADISVHGNRLFLPMMLDGRLQSIEF